METIIRKCFRKSEKYIKIKVIRHIIIDDLEIASDDSDGE